MYMNELVIQIIKNTHVGIFTLHTQWRDGM